MEKLLFILLIVTASLESLVAQEAFRYPPIKYVLLTEVDTATVKEVVMQNRRRHDQKDFEVVLYNVFYHRNANLDEWQKNHMSAIDHNIGSEFLTTLSVLGDQKTGKIHWKPIKLDTIDRYKLLTVEQLGKMAYANIDRYFSDCKQLALNNNYLKALNLIPVVRRGKELMYPDNTTLTEFYRVIDAATWFVPHHDDVTISTQARVLPFEQVRDDLLAARNQKNIRPAADIYLLEDLGGTLLLEKQVNNVYHFWSYDALPYDGSSFLYRTGDFKFIPRTGIIATTYYGFIFGEEEYFTHPMFRTLSINGVPYKSQYH